MALFCFFVFLFLFVSLILFLKWLNKKVMLKLVTIAKSTDSKTYLSFHYLSKSGEIVRILGIFAIKKRWQIKVSDAALIFVFVGQHIVST